MAAMLERSIGSIEIDGQDFYITGMTETKQPRIMPGEEDRQPWERRYHGYETIVNIECIDQTGQSKKRISIKLLPQ